MLSKSKIWLKSNKKSRLAWKIQKEKIKWLSTKSSKRLYKEHLLIRNRKSKKNISSSTKEQIHSTHINKIQEKWVVEIMKIIWSNNSKIHQIKMVLYQLITIKKWRLIIDIGLTLLMEIIISGSYRIIFSMGMVFIFPKWMELTKASG